MIVPKKISFPKHQNKAKFKKLDDSKVFSSHFSDLRTSGASTTSVASKTFIVLFLKKNTDPGVIPGTESTNTFCRMYHQKSKFSLTLAPFLSETVTFSKTIR